MADPAPYLSAEQVSGHIVQMRSVDHRHLSAQPDAGRSSATEETFGSLFFQAVRSVNATQHRAMELERQGVIEPDSVDIHDVMIAITEANLVLSTAKAVADRAISAYREIINIR